MVHYDPIPTKKAIRPEMDLWWSKYHRTNGLVIEHLSPYRQQIIRPMIKNIPHALTHTVPNVGRIAVPILGIFYATKTWALAENDREHRSHWD